MSRINEELIINEWQPERMAHAIKKITALGFVIDYQDNSKIQFMFKGNLITFFPYTGWHTGKGIIDGRGLWNLLKQLKS